MENHPRPACAAGAGREAPSALGFDLDLGRRFGDGAAAPRSADPARRRRRPHAQGGAGHGRAAAGAAQLRCCWRIRWRRSIASPKAALILGIGIAADMPAIRLEFEAMGVPFDKRVGRMNEAMRLCKALWSGKPVDWNGYWTVKQGTVGPTPHNPGGPPIWFGGGLPAGRERTGRLYDGWFPRTCRRRRNIRPRSRKSARRPARRGAIPRRSPARCIRRSRSTTTRRAPTRRSTTIWRTITARPAAGMRARQRCYAGPASV